MTTEIEQPTQVDEADHEDHMFEAAEQVGQDHFSYMYDRAETNLLKGQKGGDCNRTICQKSGASCWNRGAYSWYCAKCAKMLNEHNPMYNEEPMVNEVPDYYHPYEGSANAVRIRHEAKTVKEDKARRTARPSPNLTPKIGRNEPCPCQSGLKYKKCHGC